MANFNGSLTAAGTALIAKAQAGASIHFTRVGLGSGYMPDGTTQGEMTDLSEFVVDAEIIQISVTEDGDGFVRCQYSNTTGSGFEFRELGLFALDPDDGEILYSYANAGDEADTIPSASSGSSVQKILTIVTTIAVDVDVTAQLASVVYAEQSDVEQIIATMSAIESSLSGHITNMNNPHEVHAGQVNISANDTTKLSDFLGGALSTLITSTKASIIAAINSVAVSLASKADAGFGNVANGTITGQKLASNILRINVYASGTLTLASSEGKSFRITIPSGYRCLCFCPSNEYYGYSSSPDSGHVLVRNLRSSSISYSNPFLGSWILVKEITKAADQSQTLVGF